MVELKATSKVLSSTYFKIKVNCSLKVLEFKDLKYTGENTDIQCYIDCGLWFSSFCTLPPNKEVIISVTAVDSMGLFYVQVEENYSRLV